MSYKKVQQSKDAPVILTLRCPKNSQVNYMQKHPWPKPRVMREDCRSCRNRSPIRSGMTLLHRPGLILLDIGDDSLNVKSDNGFLALL